MLGLPPELADEQVGGRGPRHSPNGLRGVSAEDPRSERSPKVRHRRPPKEDGRQQLRAGSVREDEGLLALALG
eukprot:130717-Alexandrium_andersonii.AAC.1